MNSFTQLNWVLTLLIQCFFCQGYFFLPWFPSSPAQKSVFALCSVPFLCRLLPDNCTQSICGGANTTTAQLEAPMKMDSFVDRTSNSSKPSSLRYRVIWFGRCVWIEGSATPRRRDSASERENLLAPLQIDHAFEGWTKTAEVTGTEAADTQADGSPFDPFALIQFRRQRDQANATRWPHHHWTGSSFIEGFRVLSFAFEREREQKRVSNWFNQLHSGHQFSSGQRLSGNETSGFGRFSTSPSSLADLLVCFFFFGSAKLVWCLDPPDRRFLHRQPLFKKKSFYFDL